MGSIPKLSILKGATRPLKPDFLHRFFEGVVEKHPDKTALIYEEGSQLKQHTYDELNKTTNRMARTIISAIRNENLPSNKDGDYVIAVCLPPSDDLLKTLLAIWKSGCAYLPLDPSFPANRIEHIIRESKPVIVIYAKDNVTFGTTRKFSFEQLCDASANNCGDNLPDCESVRHLKDDLAIVLYTSGSTGVPKGVRLPHKVILNRLQWQFKTFPYAKSEDVCVFKTALTFVDSVSEIWGPLLNGLSVVVVPKCVTTDPEKLVNTLERYKIHRLVLVPSLLRALLMYLQMNAEKRYLQSLKIWVCSGETLSVSLSQDFFRYFPENEHMLCNFYGSTEIMGDVSYHIIQNNAQLQNQSKVSIGVPVDNTILYLLDKDYRPVKAGEAGELFVSGLNLAGGYVNNRDPDKFIDNPLAIDPVYSKLFRTGDFARLEKGALIFEGRTDSQVKIRGNRVDLAEVEKAVAAVDGVDKCIVLCHKPGEINQALLAFVTTDIALNESQIESTLRDRLVSYMVPQVILVDEFPLLVNGKTDRQSLLKNYENANNNCFQVDIEYAGVPKDQLPAAKVLFETVASVLNRSARSAININANFYEIGGNSLNSIFTITALKEKGFHISIGDFIAALDFGEVLDRMVQASNVNVTLRPPPYRSELVGDKHKESVMNMITTSFYEKADLERWLISEIFPADYAVLLNAIWESLLEKNLSFVVIDANDKCIGVALNFDAHDEPQVEITSKLIIIFEFLEFLEGPIRDKQLPNKIGDVLHSFMMATHSSLTAKENVALMQFMESEVMALAKERNFKGILTTNTSPLTQQLGSSVFGYKTLLDYQVNEYVAPDNTKPFGMAPDDQRAIVHWKEL